MLNAITNPAMVSRCMAVVLFTLMSGSVFAGRAIPDPWQKSWAPFHVYSGRCLSDSQWDLSHVGDLGEKMVREPLLALELA
jgi:hypothetical protein